MEEGQQTVIDLVNGITEQLPDNLKEKFAALQAKIEGLDIENLNEKASQVEGLNSEIANLKEQIEGFENSKSKGDSLAMQVVNSFNEEADKKGKKLSEIVANKGNVSIELQNFDSSNISESTVPSTGAQFNEAVLIRREATRISELIPSTNTDENTIVEPYFANETGTPAYFGEIEASPELNWEMLEKTFTVRKVGAHVIVAEDMLDDTAYMRRKVDQVLDQRSRIALDQALYSGDGQGNNIEGLKVLGTQFDATAVAASPLQGKLGPVTDSDYAKILLGAINFQEDMEFIPQVIVVNSAVLKVMQNNYSANNGLTGISTTNGTITVFMGIPILTYNRMPVDEYLILDYSVITNFYKKRPEMEVGRFNDQFIKDQVAIKWRARHTLVINPNEAGSAVWGNWTDGAGLTDGS